MTLTQAAASLGVTPDNLRGAIAPRKHRTTKVALYVVVEVDIDELEAEYGHSYTTQEARSEIWDFMFAAATGAALPSDSNDRIIPRIVSSNRK